MTRIRSRRWWGLGTVRGLGRTGCAAIAVASLSVPPVAVAQSANGVTVVLARHAETEPDDLTRDPALSQAGNARARWLAYILEPAGVTAIYSTHLTRTKTTAERVARVVGVPITVTEVTDVVEHVDDMAQRLRSHQSGDVVLVVGHSNTIPDIINALGAGPVEQLDEDEFDALFVVTLNPSTAGASLLRLRYNPK